MGKHLKTGFVIVACASGWLALFAQHTGAMPVSDSRPEAAQAERRELTATELRDREEQRRDLAALRKALVQRALSTHDSEVEADSVDPLQAARDTLDQRIREAAPNSAETSSMEQALRELLAPELLGDTSADFTCGATMCRVDLTSEDEASVEASAQALAMRRPKTFASLVVYPQGTGERAMYLARSSVALALGPEPTTVRDSEPLKP